MIWKKSMWKKNCVTYLCLALTFLGGLFLRFYKLDSSFLGSDENNHVLSAARLYSSPLFELSKRNFFLRLFDFEHGYVTLLLPYLTMRLFSYLLIPLNEAGCRFISALVGSLSIIVMYFMSYQFTGDGRTSLLSALMLSILPVHVSVTRNMAANEGFSVFFGMLLFLFFVKYFRDQQNTSNMLLAFALLALYIGSDNTFPVTLLMLFYMGILIDQEKHSANDNILIRAKRVISSLLKPRLMLLPCVILTIYILAYASAIIFGLDTGFIMRTLSKKPVLGFYGARIAWMSRFNFGLGLTIASLLALIASILQFRKFQIERLWLIWSLIQIIPIILLYGHQLEAGHMAHITIPLIMLVSSFAIQLFEKYHSMIGRALLGTICLAIIIESCITLLAVTFRVDPFALKLPIRYGSVVSDRGLKTAGYFIRHHPVGGKMLARNGRQVYYSNVFSYRENALYYFGIVYYSHLRDLSPDLDIVVTGVDDGGVANTIGSRGKAHRIINQFLQRYQYHKVAEIRTDGKVVMEIFSRKPSGLIIMDTEKYDRLFDQEFANLAVLSQALSGYDVDVSLGW